MILVNMILKKLVWLWVLFFAFEKQEIRRFLKKSHRKLALLFFIWEPSKLYFTLSIITAPLKLPQVINSTHATLELIKNLTHAIYRVMAKTKNMCVWPYLLVDYNTNGKVRIFVSMASIIKFLFSSWKGKIP